ncbi:MAG TPA: hypothetical protein VNA27_06155, partial [Rubrobacteraceae bacterium]|nr:hypothetical protein [Rubrobacteraceae bacterium]
MTKMRIVSGLVVAAILALVPSMAMAQSSASQPVDPPQQVAQLRHQFEGLTQEQIEDAGFEQTHECVPHPQGTGAMGIHFINPEYLEAQFPKGEMDPEQPPVVLLNENGKVLGIEWEAADVGQGPMELFGQTIELQPGHPGAEDPHYMLHIYFQPDDRVLFGTDPETAFNPELSCDELPASGGIVSPLELGGLLVLGVGGGLAVLGVAFVVRQ